MRQPEMSHSPAYYQDHGQLMTTYPPDSTPVTPPPARLPSESSSSPPRHHNHHSRQGVAGPPPSQPNSVDDAASHTFPSDLWDDAYGQPSYQHPQQLHTLPHRYSQQQAPVESIYRGSGQTAVAPVTNGSSRKEERVRGSWTDHSSYMSGDNHHHNHSASAPRVQKRPIHDEEPILEDNQDALLMLFRLSIPVPIFALCASLYTVFGLFFVILTSPFRLCSCIPYLKATSFRAQLCDLLVPQLHLHERLACLRRSSYRSGSTQSIYNDSDRSSATSPCDPYSIGGLIVVLLLSSLLSIAFLLLVWTAAFFWVFAMVLGNPDGTERKDDGRAAVLGVSRWWHMWLGKARKPPR